MNKSEVDKTNKPSPKPVKAPYGRLKKLYPLLEHYGIPPGDARVWLKLVICLAEEYVPNFNPRPKRIAWTSKINMQLLDEHKRNKQEFPAKTDGEIFEYMVTLSPWNTKNNTAQTLHNRFCVVKTRRYGKKRKLPHERTE